MSGQKAVALALQELLGSLIAYQSITTADGVVGKTSLIDSTLIGLNDFLTGKSVVILDGNAAREDKLVTSFNPATGEVTFGALSARVLSGTNYLILNIANPGPSLITLLADVVLLKGDVGDASASTLGSLYAILGNPAQSFNTMVGYEGTTSLANKLTAARAALLDNLAATAKGKLQEASTTIDLNQAAGTYDLFTGTTQAVILESLIIQMPVGAAAGALTSISIQTNDATPQVIIDSTTGAVANLTSEAQLSWTGKIRISTGKKIQLTIAGGAHGSTYTCNVNAECRAVVDGGYLA